MMSDNSVEKQQLADEGIQKNLPPGIKLLQTLRGHSDTIGRIAWSPDGHILASPSVDRSIRLWDIKTGNCLAKFNGHKRPVYCLAFGRDGQTLVSASGDLTVKVWETYSGKLLRTIGGHKSWVYTVALDPEGYTLASGSGDEKIKLWSLSNGDLLRTLRGHEDDVLSVVFDPTGCILASGSNDNTIKLWEPSSGELLYTLLGHKGGVNIITFDPISSTLASGSVDNTIRLWDPSNGSLLRTLEGHTSGVNALSFDQTGSILASASADNTFRLWNSKTGVCLATVPMLHSEYPFLGLAFHPHLPLLATVGSDPDTSKAECDKIIHIWELDLPVLLHQSAKSMVAYTSAKVVLLGDSGVGKTGLGWRLAHGEFNENLSTHGQQFWMLDRLCKQRLDGAECETVLWDLGEQPDYRLIHALFLDDADLALVLFDPTHNHDPLSNVEYWLRQLKVEAQPPSGTPTFLIAARSDRGTPSLTEEELNSLCKQRGIKAYFLTSAASGEGIEELLQQMQNIIPWDDKPATITTDTFKRIKDFILNLKEDSFRQGVILKPEELRQRLEEKDRTWKFSDDEMFTAVRHLENHGYVTRLKTSQGETCILLSPELLNNLAASFVLEARRNPKGLGSLEEHQILSGEYKFPELEQLTKVEKDILLDSVTVLFLEHNICFRETDPLNGRTYLVFPELINLKKPILKEEFHFIDCVAYTVKGITENVYASLVVLMGYTPHFIRANQWQNHARYETGKDFVCGFRLEEERAGELDFVLYFREKTPPHVRNLFQSLFENFLFRRNLTVHRFKTVKCPDEHILNLAVVRQKMSSGAKSTFCNDCGKETTLPKSDKPIYLTEEQMEEMEANCRAVNQRSRFEQVLFRLKSNLISEGINSPECFISYAWGDQDQELWVEQELAMDLQKAGIRVILDRWENALIGLSVPRFLELVGKADIVLVIGTPLYRKKYENEDPMRYIVAVEGDIIGNRMLGTEKEKNSVLPVLLEGTAKSSFPIMLQGRTYADFRKKETYFDELLKLLLSINKVLPNHPFATELIESQARKNEYEVSLKTIGKRITL